MTRTSNAEDVEIQEETKIAKRLWRAKRKQLRKLSQARPFQGTTLDKNVEAWLSEVGNLAEVYKLTENEKQWVIILSLQGQAVIWYQSLSMDMHQNTNKLAAEIKKVYRVEKIGADSVLWKTKQGPKKRISIYMS